MEVAEARGSHIYDSHGNAWLDFVAGVSANSVGHSHPAVVKAIREQAEKYLHVMVYGEYVLEPAVSFTKKLSSLLPPPLETTYLVNSGAEAIEGAMKLAKRVTGKSKFVAAHNAYHGNTHGALSLMGYEERKAAFRPLLPGVSFLKFNKEEDLQLIDDDTAAVILETIQGGAGFIEPQNNYLQKVKTRCEEVGALLILDEIQPGFGRTGALFGFMNYGVTPDILVMGKGMAGGLPVGAFTASAEHMATLQENPKLGHITTFGGNPLIAAAANATLDTILEEDLMRQALEKEKLIRTLLVHPLIKEIRGKGLMLALILESEEAANFLVLEAQKEKLILFWLLFEKRAVRITPPLTISKEEIELGCRLILKVLDRLND
nr:aminotransferase class III-fold pyridoxal phosphate-dependent enzyme [Robertkochia sp. 3YJGBD-33]